MNFQSEIYQLALQQGGAAYMLCTSIYSEKTGNKWRAISNPFRVDSTFKRYQSTFYRRRNFGVGTPLIFFVCATQGQELKVSSHFRSKIPRNPLNFYRKYLILVLHTRRTKYKLDMYYGSIENILPKIFAEVKFFM